MNFYKSNLIQHIIIVVQNKSITPDYWRKPWVHTVAYFPFETDATDHSWNWNVLENTQYLSKQTLWYKRQFSQWTTWRSYNVQFTNSQWNAKFISMWYRLNSASWNSNWLALMRYWTTYSPSHERSDMSWKIAVFTNSSWRIGVSVNWMSFNAWHHLTIWYDWSKILISKDGVQSTLYNWSWYNFGNEISIAWWWNNTNMIAFVSEFICEDRCRTQEEITKYYNKTKSKYWL